MFPKPKDIKQPKLHYREFADGRIVFDMKMKAGRDAYAANVKTMYARQNKRCGLQISEMCKAKDGRLNLEFAQFDHDAGRGSGGSKRDDRIEKLNPETGKMEPVNHAVCCWCNVLKGSRPRSSFQLTEFVP